MKITSTQRAILQAACHLIQREGVACLTLDNVAQESHLSKGGLRYHFHSKDELIQGMVVYLTLRFEQDIALTVDSYDQRPGSWVRGFIRASCIVEHTDVDSAAGLVVALIPSIAVVLAYGVSFTLLSFSLKQLPIGIAYANWSGMGTVLIALVGIIFFKEPMVIVKMGSIALIVASVVGLQLSGGH